MPRVGDEGPCIQESRTNKRTSSKQSHRPIQDQRWRPIELRAIWTSFLTRSTRYQRKLEIKMFRVPLKLLKPLLLLEQQNKRGVTPFQRKSLASTLQNLASPRMHTLIIIKMLQFSSLDLQILIKIYSAKAI